MLDIFGIVCELCEETLSPFIDSSIDKVLFQTNRVLDTQLRIIFATLFTTAVLKF